MYPDRAMLFFHLCFTSKTRTGKAMFCCRLLSIGCHLVNQGSGESSNLFFELQIQTLDKKCLQLRVSCVGHISLFQAPREKRAGEDEGTKTRGTGGEKKAPPFSLPQSPSFSSPRPLLRASL